MSEIANMRGIKKDLGDLLVEKEIISAEQLLFALDKLSQESHDKRRRLPQILVEDLHIDHDKVYGEIANYYAFRQLEISQESVDDEGLAFIRRELNNLPANVKTLAMDNRVLPFAEDPERPGRLLVITPDPTKREVYTIGRSFSFQKFEICYVRLGQWQELWQRVNISRSGYASLESEVREGMADEVAEEDADIYEQALEEEISRSGLVNLVESIFIDAVRMGASDIHVVPRGEKKTEFHFRIDGKLTLWYTNMETRAEAVSAVVKDRAMNLDRFERNMAQDGFAQFNIDKKTVRFRVSVIPTIGKELKSKYESIVIRVLQEPQFSTRLEDMGFDPFSENAFRKAITKPYGMVIVTGPTGSGKSTTLFSALRTVMDPSLNVITVEDPVEYFIDGARQVKLNPKLDFEGALRAILRHDPDIVMVGEIRDRQTAEIAIKLANTGHLTLATLHTNDAVSAIARLFKMGVEPFLLAYSINIVLSQRLIRKLCDRCKTVVEDPDREALIKLGMKEEEIAKAKMYRPVGCSNCLKGYKGRMAIHEALYFTKAIRQLVLRAGDLIDEEGLREQAFKEGMHTLRMSGLDLLKKGITTLEEVASVTIEDD
ncbi:MAG: Flp pilus assembly complex ATPase component TadA [Ignavibacteriales bacterium]|nr:Flp pilus assembly complex ATPase component TadA [Ignavibacteriales bacterium]